jgi:transposase InsO family protein
MKPLAIIISFDVGKQVMPGSNPGWIASFVHELGFDRAQAAFHRGIVPANSFPAHPTAEWIARQLTEACGWDGTPEYLVRDHDTVYGEIFTHRLRTTGIRDRPIAPRSPWQNGHAERLIGSLRRECLDHVIVFGAQHLRQLLLLYKDYYNRVRTHFVE